MGTGESVQPGSRPKIESPQERHPVAGMSAMQIIIDTMLNVQISTGDRGRGCLRVGQGRSKRPSVATTAKKAKKVVTN